MPWTPPIGIPTPNWPTIGNPIDAIAPTPPSPWTGNVANNYYIESGGTNPNEGYPGNPRNAIPSTIPAGSKVFVNGTYTTSHRAAPLTAEGSAASPVWILSYDPETPCTATKQWDIQNSSYLITDFINWDWRGEDYCKLNVISSDHICFRNGSTIGNGTEAGTSVAAFYNQTSLSVDAYTAYGDAEQIVYYNMDIAKGGNWQYGEGTDPDAHGFACAQYAQDIWIVDCTFSYFSGCAMQIGAGLTGSTPDTQVPRRIYVGRNTGHHIAQTAFFTKRADVVIFSQNVAYTMRRDCPSSPDSAGFGAQYGPKNVWIIGNTVYDCQAGVAIQANSLDTGVASTTDVYIIGNLFYDIHDPSGDVITNGGWRNWLDAQGGVCISIKGCLDAYIINNTFDDYDAGIMYPDGAYNRFIEGNIFTSRNSAVDGGDIILYRDDGAANTVKNNIIEENSGTCYVRISSGGGIHTTVAALNAAKGPGNSNTPPTYTNEAGRDYTLSAASNGIDDFGATAHAVYDLFETNYGLSIAVDNSGGIRPWSGDAATGAPGGNWDLGAFEFGSATYSAPPPSELPDPPTFSVSRHITPNSPS